MRVIWAWNILIHMLIPKCHSIISSSDDFSIDFGRIPKWNCPEPEQEPEISATGNPPKTFTGTTNVQIRTTTPAATVATSSSYTEDLSSGSPNGHPQPAISDQGTSYLIPSAWKVPPIPCYEPEDRIFYAQLGPSGRKEVFKAITGNHFPTTNINYKIEYYNLTH